MAERTTSESSTSLTSMTGFLLQRSGAMLLARAEQVLADRGFRVRDCYILAALADTPDLSQHDLSQMIGLDAGTLGAIVDDMEAARRIARQRSPKDKRRYVLNITDDGKALLGMLLADMRQIEQDFLSALSPVESATMRGYLERALAEQSPDLFTCVSSESDC